ncbi:hypothetical protein AAG570_004270 [Ranatra chinensis]|uniref:Cytosol aminopeptidase n=1 Tax=Ranatra chinensis TaxID=642074 RepID=A0ABD0YQ40_9HEMI
MGQDCLGYNPKEEMDEQKETIRMAAAAGARALQDLELPTIYVDNFCHAESAAEGAAMGLWVYQKDKKESMQKPIPKIELYDSPDWVGWQVGLQKASAQNLARQLMETPANLLTPTAFSLSALEVLTKSGVNVELKVRNWAKLRNFNAFLAVANGSCQPPIFLEASYEGCDPDIPPIVLIGKGVTFDAGGISGKSAEDMKHTRGDMGGAATVVAAMRANLLGTCAYKPGEIITAHNGKSILVQDTSNEGRLMLADALSYSAIYNPKFIVDVGTLTKDVAEVFGTTAAGVFTNSDSLYDLLRIASIHTGDRIWRFPLWENYSEEVTGSQFVPAGRDWLHIDCCGILRSSGRYQTYLREGMSGRPTRTLVEFLSQFACRE